MVPVPAVVPGECAYRREFGLQSLVWARVLPRPRRAPPRTCCSGSGVGGFVVVSVVTGTPVLAALVFWGLWHARRTFGRLDMAAFAG